MRKIDRKNVEDILPLTPTQSGMLFHYLRSPECDHYFVQLSMEVRGDIDRQAFGDAWVSLTDVNEMLRTTFRWEESAHPIQIILKKHIPQISYMDFSKLKSCEAQKACDDFKEKDKNTPIDLQRVPFRVALLRLAAQRNQIVVTYHNIICDGWSIGIILDELQSCYAAFRQKREPGLPLKARLKEFIAWTRKQDTRSAPAYWTNYLAGAEACALSVAHSTSEHADTARSGRFTVAFAPKLVAEIQRFARARRTTLSAVLYSAWAVVLARYTDRDDVIFGTVVAGRPPEIPDIGQTVGMFANTPPLRIRLHSDDTFAMLLTRIQENLALRREHELTAVVDIQAACGVEPGDSLFNNIFAVENYPLHVNSTMCDGEIRVESYAFDEATHYDLSILAQAFDGLVLDYCYNQSKFDGPAVQNLDAHYKNILAACLQNSEMRLSDVEMLCHFERPQVLETFNHTSTTFPQDKTVMHEFEAAAMKHHDRLAMVCGKEAICYREFKSRVDNCARILHAKGVRQGTVVAIMMERTIAMVATIFGILKVGATYLPLSQSYPDSRIRTMLQDSGTDVLIRGGEAPAAYEYANQVIDPSEFGGWNETDGVDLTEIGARPEGAAYIIYTSGSTGNPKGVVVTHRSIMNLMTWLSRYHELTANDVVLQSTSITFDVSVWELYWWMFAGASLCLLQPGEERDPAAIVNALRDRRVTVAHFVPSSLVAFLDHVKTYACASALDSLRLLFCSGEALPGSAVEHFWRVLGGNPRLRLFNKYGPTETTVWSSSYECTRAEAGPQSVSIGRPIDNTALYVLGQWQQLQPVGVWGELYIAGAGLANGYLNRPELTADRFRLLPTRAHENVRGYKTGDIVRWRTDGTLDYLGRRDDQVKIRGHRVELGEIEFCLKAIEGIKSAAVVARRAGDNELSLWAYYTTGRELSASELDTLLSERLPRFMIPTHFIQMDSLPVLPSGKINVRALKEQCAKTPTHHAAATNDILCRLISIWSDVLRIDQAKIEAGKSFFELGGNSISAVRMITAIYRDLDVSMPLSAVFENPTAEALAIVVRKAKRTRLKDIPETEAKDYYELSYGQKRLWMIQQLHPNSGSYNMVGTFEFDHAVDPAAVTAALNAAIHRHDSLRTRFATVNAAPVQIIAKNAVAEVRRHDLSHLDHGRDDARRTLLFRESTTPFDLSRCPLLRATLVKLSASRFELVVALPHIIADGWSLQILQDEFKRDFYKRGAKPDVGPAIQYKDYAAWQQRELADRRSTSRAKDFWRAVLVPELDALCLPYDYSADGCRENRSAGYRVALSSDLTERVRRWSQEQRSGIFLSQAAALNLTLRHITGEEDFLIGFPAAARQHPSLRDIVGMFANTLVLRAKIDSDASLANYCAATQSQLLLALDYQNIPLELVCEELRIPFPSFFVFLNLLNMDVQGLSSLNDISCRHIFEVQESKFPLHFYITEYSNSIEILCHYYSNRFKPDTITRIIEIYIHYLCRIVTAPEQLVRASNPAKMDGHEIAFAFAQ